MLIKKVAAYPIPCQLIGAGSTIAAQVIKAAPSGCLISTAAPLVVNAKYQLKFQFPVTAGSVDEEVVVFKTHDALKGAATDKGAHVAEVIFKKEARRAAEAGRGRAPSSAPPSRPRGIRRNMWTYRLP